MLSRQLPPPPGRQPLPHFLLPSMLVNVITETQGTIGERRVASLSSKPDRVTPSTPPSHSKLLDSCE